MPEIIIKHEHDLVFIAPKESSAYGEISLAHLTAYSLFWLHQWQLRRTIEAIAVLNWRLFPTKFAMLGFPEYPDAFRTNRSLLQGQPKYRNLLTGAASKGFSLNERGIQIARDLIRELGAPETVEGNSLDTLEKSVSQPGSTKTETKLARSIEPHREVQRVRDSRLFEKWKSGVMGERDLIHVHSLLGVFDHTPTKVKLKAMKDLEQSANDVGDDEVLKFLQELRQAFPLTFMLKSKTN